MTDLADRRAPLPYGGAAYNAAVDFLYREAEILDERRHEEWLALLTDDVRYVVPVRVTSAHSLADSALEDMAHFDEDKYSLSRRVARFDTGHAWAEDPPSRLRHHLSNVRTFATENENELVVESAVLLFRSRGDVLEPSLLSVGRVDLLRLEDGVWRLARRHIAADESVLRMQNLAVFL